MATITFDGVTKAHGNGQVAVSNLDLHVADGEFLILVGPSGCGKSTVLRMVAGLDAPTSGRLLIDGVLANGLAPRERDVAMVFQSYALYPHLSVGDNVGFGLKVRGADPAAVAGKVREVAAVLELTDLLGRRPAQLSGGQRQRVAMARALVRSPSAFLMDEPLSNLDARLRGHMREEIARLQRRTGVTTLYVTHDQVEAMTMGSRVAVLNRGRLHQVDTPRALYDAPCDRFVARFIGSPEMNMFEAAVESDGAGGAALRIGRHRLPVAAETPLAAALAARGRPQVVLGLRPEGFRPAREGEAGALAGTVRFVEHLGATTLAAFDLEGVRALTEEGGGDDGFAADRRPFKALLGEGFSASPGEPLRLAVDVGRLHAFDPETGLALQA